MTQYVLSLLAEKDIDEINSYLMSENVTSARKFIESLHNTAILLAENPYIGHTRTDLTSYPVRFYTFKWHYLIIYKACLPLEIVRVLSGYRDIANIINNNE
ncbi:MAG: type II toxin-antitoxin system RelE/ParE family toxin [Gammaproteobacteria bacterium]|nr:type II toxin-antitoxin system RelE/ParE family toxin [Gammaproteobacteria bacterium]